MIDLVSLDDMKQHLDMTGTDEDAELKSFIASGTAVVEDYVGIIVPKTYVERHSAGPYLTMFHGPVLSVTAVEGFLAPLAVPLSGGQLVLDGERSRIYRADGGEFNEGPYRVTYIAGRTTITENYRMAARIIIAHMWRTQRGSMSRLSRFPSSSGDEPGTPVGITYSVPRKALELLRDERRDRVVVA